MSENDSGCDEGPRSEGARYDLASDEPCSIAIVTAVAEMTGRDPRDLPPIENGIDAEALDRLVASFDESTTACLSIEFHYWDYVIEVSGNRSILVRADSFPDGVDPPDSEHSRRDPRTTHSTTASMPATDHSSTDDPVCCDARSVPASQDTSPCTDRVIPADDIVRCSNAAAGEYRVAPDSGDAVTVALCETHRELYDPYIDEFRGPPT